MRKATIETGAHDRPRPPRELAAALRGALSIAAALVLVVLLDTLGAVAAIDEGLQRRYVALSEALGASRETTDSIVLVAADHDTVQAWGPPPWPTERLQALVDQVVGSRAELVAELGHTRMWEPSPALERIVDAHAGELLLADADEALRSPWSGVGLAHGELVLGPNSRLHALAERSARLPTIPERLPVHWLTPSSRLPVVPAHQVAAGKIPARTFANRVVVLGLTDRDYAMPVATPIGTLSPVEVEAHALIGLADGVVWAELPIAWTYLGCAGLGLALLVGFHRLGGVRLAVLVSVGIAALLLVDFTLYQRGVVRLGSAHAMLTVIGLALSYSLSEATTTLLDIRRLRARVLRATEVAAGPGRETRLDAEFWQDLAELGCEYAQELVAGFAATTVLERVGEGWTLAVRASAKLDELSHAQLVTRAQMDIRRAPFRTPWLTLRASSTTELLPSGPLFERRRSLLIPLMHDGELLGLWLVHVSESLASELERSELEAFERLGRQMATALIRRRERLALRDHVEIRDTGRPARLRDHVETIVGGLRLLRDEQRWALELLEQLPVRSMIATVWGEIEFVDPRLRSDLERGYPGLLEQPDAARDLRVVLARLTGSALPEAHRLMRKVVRSGVAIELDTVPGVDDPGHVWVLARIRSSHGIDLPGFRPAVHEHILLMARSSAPAKTVETRSGALLRVLGSS